MRDSLLRPLVTKLKPCVSMATPVRWICSSTYLMEDKEKRKHRHRSISMIQDWWEKKIIYPVRLS